jgi:hypothetical protein
VTALERREASALVRSRGDMGVFARLRSKLAAWLGERSTTAGAAPSHETSTGAATPPRAVQGYRDPAPMPPVVAPPPLRPDFVSDASEVPGLVVRMLERNGNTLVERREGDASSCPPHTEYLFAEPLRLTREQHRVVKKYVTNSRPDRPMESFAVLGRGGPAERFVWADSEIEHLRRDRDRSSEVRRRATEARHEALRRRVESAVRDGTIPPPAAPLRVSRSSDAPWPDGAQESGLGPWLASLGVVVLRRSTQPDDVTQWWLDRDVRLPPSMFVRLQGGEDAPEVDADGLISITRLRRPWERYHVADDLTRGELLLERLERARLGAR